MKVKKPKLVTKWLNLSVYDITTSIDTHWTDHIDTMDHSRQGIHLRSYAQQNPLRDYQNEGHELFDMMMQNIEEDTSKFIPNL